MEQASHHHAAPEVAMTLGVAKRGMATASKTERVRPRPALVAIAIAAFTLGVLRGWDVLVAVGIAAVVTWALPWAAMAALDLYLIHMGESPCSTDTGMRQSATTTREPRQLARARRTLRYGPATFSDRPSTFNGESVVPDQLQQQERRPTHA